MKPVNFPQANCTYGAPADCDPSQISTIPAFRGTNTGGNMDGQEVAVVAWKLDDLDMERVKAGALIYLVFAGGLPPHFAATEFPMMIRGEG